MTDATIVKVWRDGQTVSMAVAVEETPGIITEYIGTVPLSAVEGLAVKDQRAALVAAVTAARDASWRALQDVPGITGTVTL